MSFSPVIRLATLVVVLLSTVPTANANHGVEPNSPESEPKVRLVSKYREAQLRKLIPKVDDTKIQQVLDDPALLLYTEAEMPKAYQHWQGELQGVHSPDYNISAVSSEPVGNGNVEFPWSAPAGTHRSPHVNAVRFLRLPRDANGKRLPVVWYRKLLPGDTTLGYAWTFPLGTVLGEVLCVRSPDGYDYPFELRVRIRESGDWAVDAFRPYPTAESLAHRIKAIRPQWQEQPSVAKLVQHLEAPLAMQVHTLVDKQPYQSVFRQSMGVDSLPSVDDKGLLVELLTKTKFTSALGTVWRTSPDGTVTCAPTTEARFHIVPANYDGGFIEVDRVSCMRCHETTSHHVNRFDPGRDWYGRVRGSDGIFSFHPFDPGSISHNGFGQPVTIRAELTAGGIFQQYDPKRHDRSTYNQVVHIAE